MNKSPPVIGSVVHAGGASCDLAAEPAADGELGGVRQGERRGLCGIRCVGEDALVEHLMTRQ
jgi:hypothetical protein